MLKIKRNKYILTYLISKEVMNMQLLEIKTATITEKGQIAIPNYIRKNKGFKTGSRIAILAFDDHIELRPMEQINDKLFPALVSEEVLAKSWNTKKEDEAWKDL